MRKAKGLTPKTLKAELGASQGRADPLIVFDASALVSAAMDAGAISHHALRRARATQLEAMREHTPRGGTRWHRSSVKHLLARAEQLSLACAPPAQLDPGAWR
jgi:hypothetical protein